MSKKIMILGASILQLPAIKKAKEMGLEVVAVDMNPDALGFKETGVEKEIISTIDIPAVVDAARRHSIDGIMTLASDMPMRTVAAVAKEMGLVGIDERTALKATDKYEMRKALQGAGVPIPVFYKASSEEEFLAVAKRFSGRFITKPVDNSGSRGVFLVDDSKKGLAAFRYSKTNSRNGNVLVEEYMEGPEVSVETISIDGVCHVIQITDKLTTGAPHFVEMGHSQPSQLQTPIIEKIKKIAVAANKAIGIVNGPSHTEIIVTGEGPKVVEIGARLGGDCITTHLVPLSTGVDMVKECINCALGKTVNIRILYDCGSAIRYIKQKTGVLKSISGVEEAKMAEGVKEVYVSVKPGNTVSEIENSASRIGFVIAQGKSSMEAIEACDQALKRIKVDLEAKVSHERG